MRFMHKLSVATLLLAGSCAAPEVDLLDADRDLSEQRTRRMNLVVQEWAGSDWGEGTEMTVSALRPSIAQHCLALVAESPELSSCSGYIADTCSNASVCPAASSLCEALTLRELVHGRSDSDRLTTHWSAGISSVGTRTWMVRALPGCRWMRPRFSSSTTMR
ncbi:MAG: hypothetical protein SangKO_073860 [Sandaracinaceae bacterium]